jgi:hypothetical protein
VKPEPTVEEFLLYLGRQAEDAMLRFARVLEERRLAGAESLNTVAYAPVSYLHALNRDFELPGEWPHAIDEIWNEYQRLADLWRRIQREKTRGG